MFWRAIFFVCVSFLFPYSAKASLKLPYTSGVSMLVSRAYDTPATHVNKDRYALDFVQNGCESYGSEVRAVESGEITFVNTRDTWGGGYGKNIILAHANEKISRYAHLSKYGNKTKVGEIVQQGEIIGYQGNTGNVVGAACASHPGTHLHFAYLYSGVPEKPEPMSLYPTFKAGNWYVSDNMFPLQKTEMSEEKKKENTSWFQHIWSKFSSIIFTPDFLTTNEKKSNVFISEQVASSTVLVSEEQREGKFILEEHSYTVSHDATEVQVNMRIHNTGKSDWTNSSVSLNIVGGEKESTRFHHSTWRTRLRPIEIERKVSKGAFIDLSFYVSIPVEEKSTVQFQLVHNSEGVFSRIDTEFARIDIFRDVSITSLPVLPFEEGPPDEQAHTTEVAVLFVPEVHPSSVGGGSFIEVASVANYHEESDISFVVSTTTTIETNSSTVVMNTSTIPINLPATTILSTTTTIITTTTTPSSTEPLILEEEKTIPIPLFCADPLENALPLYVSPRALLETRLSGDEEVITLTAEEGPYILGIDTTVPKTKTLIINEGAVIYGESKKASLIVEGSIVVQGSASLPVVFTSLCDGLNPHPGDWSHIRIAEGGIALMQYAAFRYAGDPFTISHGVLASSETVSRVIFNEGGEVLLDHVHIEASHVQTSDEQLSSYIWVENTPEKVAKIVSEYGWYSDGYRAIHIEGANTHQYIEGTISHNTFEQLDSASGPMTIHRDIPQMEQNVFIGNARDGVFLENSMLIGSHIFETGKTYWLSGMIIEEEALLRLLPGSEVRLYPGTDIIVYGAMHAEGTNEMPIIIMPDTTKWGSIIVQNAEASFYHVDMSGGGLSRSVTPGMSRMVDVTDSIVSISQSHIHDSRIPGVLVRATNSLISVSKNIFSWDTLLAVPSWVTYGVYMEGGELTTAENVFHNIRVPMYTAPDTVIDEEGMEESL